MKTRIVFFMDNSLQDIAIINSIKNGGFPVSKAQSFSELHAFLSNTLTAAVVINLATMHRYHIKAKSHLNETKSPVAIITWEKVNKNTIQTQISCMLEGSCDDLLAAKNRNTADKIALLVRAGGTIEENGDLIAHDCSNSYGIEKTLLPKITVHRKMHRILEFLVESGTAGASSDEIIRYIWPNSDKDRRQDLQSYISKLRRSLQITPNFKINFTNKKYKVISDKE